jgi:P2-related tail formation protein
MMGKKVKRKTKVSKGIHSNVTASTLKAVRNDVSELTRALHKLDAWKKGKNPWITVPGTASNARFIKVRANSIYGDPKKSGANLFGVKADVV